MQVKNLQFKKELNRAWYYPSPENADKTKISEIKHIYKTSERLHFADKRQALPLCFQEDGSDNC